MRVELVSSNSNSLHHKFSISYTFESKELLLHQGVDFVGNLNAKNPNQTFLLEIARGSENVTILKHIYDGVANFELQFADTTSADSFNVGLTQYTNGIFLTSEILQKSCKNLKTQDCHLFIKASTYNYGHFSLAFTTDSNPFRLSEDLMLNLPTIFSTNITYNLIYELPADASDKFDFKCENWFNPYECYIKFVKSSDEHLYPSIDKFDIKLDTEQKLVEITKEKYEGYNFMLVTVGSTQISEFLRFFANPSQSSISFVITGEAGVIRGMHTIRRGKHLRVEAT